MSIPALRIIAITIALVAFSGCASKQKQLESVAKDWSMTIRASQVIPVYPLTEDLQPGDVFLVTVPVQKQVEIYKKKGFLPLDLMVTRLHGLDYTGFYAAEYWAGDFIPPNGTEASDPPKGTGAGHSRMVRGADKTPSGGTVDGESQNSGKSPRAPLGAPRAAFPTYTFSVEKGFGARLAIPVQGVPVAMGLMGSSSAYGSVTISDAYTYAAPTEDLIKKLNDWIDAEPRRKAMLSHLEEANEQTLYLRVVQRVYMTGGVVVSVTNSQSGGAAVEADLSALGNSGEAGSATGAQGIGTAPPAKTAVVQVETFTVTGEWNEEDWLTTKITTGEDRQVTTKVGANETTAKEVRDQHLNDLNASKDPLFKAIEWKAGSDDSMITGTGKAGDEFDAEVSYSSNTGKYTKAGTIVQAPPAGAGYAETSAALNAALAGGNKPGASLQIIQASSRSVTMKENFDRPLVIGYIGFDFPILEKGDLGVPIATLNQLEKREAKTPLVLLANMQSSTEANYNTIFNKYAALEKSDKPAAIASARKFVIDAASLINDDGVKAVGNKAGKKELPKGLYVKSLRTAVNKYLSSEPSGTGSRHKEVLSAVREANKYQE